MTIDAIQFVRSSMPTCVVPGRIAICEAGSFGARSPNTPPYVPQPRDGGSSRARHLSDRTIARLPGCLCVGLCRQEPPRPEGARRRGGMR